MLATATIATLATEMALIEYPQPFCSNCSNEAGHRCSCGSSAEMGLYYTGRFNQEPAAQALECGCQTQRRGIIPVTVDSSKSSPSVKPFTLASYLKATLPSAGIFSLQTRVSVTTCTIQSPRCSVVS